MFAFHATRRALHVLLAGAALAMPLAGVKAQTPIDFTETGDSAITLPTRGLFGGVWVATRDLNGRERYFKLTALSSGQVWGTAHLAGTAEPTGSLSLSRTAADRLQGSYSITSGTTVSSAITAPVKKPYRFLELTHDGGGKTGFYLRRVSDIGTPSGAPIGAAVREKMVGRWDTSLGALTIKDEGGKLVGRFHKLDGSTYLQPIIAKFSPTTETQRWAVGHDPSGNEIVLVLSPDASEFRIFDDRGFLNGAKQITAVRLAEAPAPTPSPAPLPPQTPQPTEPTPAPPPAPVTQAPAPAGTVQAGIFHSLEAFDVRLDEARAARDGTVHLFFTVRNDTGRDQQIGAGTFTAVMSDADGVGVREAQIWRASGDTPTQFDRPPVVAPGGELKFRFVLTPPIVHAPLQRVSIRENDKKALFFTVSGADPNPSRAGAPAPGGGAFKSLSKFDVRIDRLTRARDGLLEAFLTLRNPGTSVETTSKGWIKLSGAAADGGKATSRSALYSVRGERGNHDELPLLVYVEPGQQVRLRYVFDQAISGPITISDGSVSQTFTAG